MKICSRCNIEKNLDLFHKNPTSKDGLNSHCKDCCKDHYEQNRERKLQYSKIYETKNKVERYKYRKKYNNIRYNQDLDFKLKRILRSRFLDALKRHIKGGKVNKNHSSLEILNCSIEQCKKWLENQFHPSFTWNNLGEIWEIDHIKPCSIFNLINESEQRECFHYTNLMPRFKTSAIAEQYGSNQIGNRNKGAKIIN